MKTYGITCVTLIQDQVSFVVVPDKSQNTDSGFRLYQGMCDGFAQICRHGLDTMNNHASIYDLGHTPCHILMVTLDAGWWAGIKEKVILVPSGIDGYMAPGVLDRCAMLAWDIALKEALVLRDLIMENGYG